MKTTACIFIATMALALATAHAVEVTFPVGTPVTNNAGIYTVIVGEFKFSNSIAINIYSDAVRHAGGLWVDPGGGVGVKIERVDGRPFSIESMSVMERPGISGSIAAGNFVVTAYEPGNATAFSRAFRGDANNQNYDTFLVSGWEPRFGNSTSAWLKESYSFILDSITLGPPAVNAPQPEPIVNLIADASLEVDPGDPIPGTVTAGAWSFSATTTIVPPGGVHNAAAPADGERIAVIYPAEETGPLPEISQVINIPVTGSYRLGWWEVGGPPIEGFLTTETHYLNYNVIWDTTTVVSRQAQNRSGYGIYLNPLPSLVFQFRSTVIAATAGPHTLRFRVSSRFDTGGGGLAYFDAISLIATRQPTWPLAAPALQLIPLGAGKMGVAWDTVPGIFYRLEDSSNLGTWTQPGPFQAPLTRRAEIVTLPAGAPAHFFRTKFSSTTFAPGQ